MINKIFNKLGYTKLEFVRNSNNRLHVVKSKLKTAHLELNDLQKKHKELKEKIKQTNMLIPNLGRQKLKAWADKVKKVGCCDICNSGRPLQAHHLWSKSLHPTLGYEKTNGVALCLDCHDGYHKKYHRIEDCNPYTYGEFKTDEQNKIRLTEVEIEVKELQGQGLLNFLKGKFNLYLR